MKTIETPVLIIGGGGTGLTASMLLHDMGIESYLINHRPRTSRLPKAHVLHQRSMEIFRRLGGGLADDIAEQGTPAYNMSKTGFYAGVGGDHPNAGRLLMKLDSWGNGGGDPDWRVASPEIQQNLPQLYLEPLLKRHAESRAPESINFHHELIGLDQDEDGVTARVMNLETNEEYEVRAQYVIGADGGRTVGNMINVGMENVTDDPASMYVITIHMKLDLSDISSDDDVLLRWCWPPHHPGTFIVMVPMGPDNWGPNSTEWVCHMFWLDEASRPDDNETYLEILRDVLWLEDREVEPLMITRWQYETVVAEKYREGRVFLAGDAAHRHGPTGGLGLNTGIQDAENLTWKLAEVLRGNAGEDLLDTYEDERRPVAVRNVRRSTENGRHHFLVAEELGLHPGLTKEEAWAQMDRYWSEKPEDAEFRHNVRKAMRNQSMEFIEHNVEFGYEFDKGAFVPANTRKPKSVDDMRIYTPSTRPGAHVPHAVLVDEWDNNLNIADLVKLGEYLLIAGEEGQPWLEAASAAAEATGVTINAVTIGHSDGEYFDERLAWLRRREIDRKGAVLVRPDGVVAWRNLTSSENPTAELTNAVRRFLSVPVQEPAAL